MMPWDYHWQWWDRIIAEIVAEQRAIEAAEQRAERAEANRDETAAEVERLTRVYKALKSGIRLPFMNAFPTA
jgi:hypothetical protein